MKYKEFFAELFKTMMCKECGMPLEECECGKEADTRLYPEEYPYGGYKVTNRDVEADERLINQSENSHKQPIGKLSLMDKYRIAKKALYKQYLTSKDNRDSAISAYLTAKTNLYQRYLHAKAQGKNTL